MAPETTATTSDLLIVSVLGPLRAERGGTDIPLGGRRQRAVLARLALAGGDAVAAERIIDDLWHGDPPASATNTLQSYVSNLRRLLTADDGPVIERVGDAYALRLAPEQLVAERFERTVSEAARLGPGREYEAIDQLTAALSWWRGAAVADFSDEPWAQGDAVRLEELRLAALEARVDAHLALGLHGVVVGELETAANEHPLRERFTAQLVLALYRCGRQAEALRAYERLRVHLGEELGLDPSPALARLATQVLDHDRALDAPPATPRPSPSTPASPSAVDPAPPVPDGSWRTAGPLPLPPAVAERRHRTTFVGRAATLDTARAAWAEVVDGERRILTITGEPGLGKTRVAQQVAREVHEGGGHVLWGRCSAENLVAYQPVVEALRTGLRSVHEEVARSVLDGRPALAPLVPELSTTPADTRIERFDLYEALADLLGETSEGAPVLLVVDDLQWADPSTLVLIEQVLSHHRTGRLLVLATLRRPAGRPTREVDALLAAQRRDGRLVEVALDGLAAEEVVQLLDERGVNVDRDGADRLRTRTGGNPFFLESLADQGGDLLDDHARVVPDSIRDVIDQRLLSLDAEATTVLVAAAVIGQRVDLALLGQVTERGPDELLDVIDAAVAAGLLTEDEDLGWVTFPHALVRQALVSRSTRNREARLHLRIAEAIEGRPATADRPAQLAHHLLAAGRLCPPERAAAAALAAAERALALFADEEARALARRALDALADHPDHDLAVSAQFVVARAARNTADLAGARDAIDTVADLARTRGDGLLLARAAQEAAQLQAGVGFSFGTVDDALLAILDEALAALPDGHPAERALILSWQAIGLVGADDPDAITGPAEEAWSLAESRADRPDVLALAAYARRLSLAGPDAHEERLRLGPIHLAAAEAAGWTELELIGLLFNAVDLLEADRVEESHASHERLRARLAAGDRPMFDTYVHFLDGGFHLLAGDLAAAELSSTTALTRGEAAHGGNATQGWAAQQFLLANYRGDLPTLIPIVEDLVAQFPSMPAWRAGLATCRVAAGDPAGAAEAYRAIYRGDGLPVAQEPTWYTTVSQLAEVAWNVDDVDLARRLEPLLTPIADRVAITGMGAICLGHLRRSRGLVLAVLGRLEEADADLARAIERDEACGWRPWLARGCADRAEVLRRLGRSAEDPEVAALDARAVELAAELGIRLRLTPPPGDGGAGG